MMLCDKEINEERAKNRLVLTPDLNSSAQVQPASLDLLVGKIYVPGDEKQLRELPPEKQKHSVMPGETVLVQTREKITLDITLGAFGFPPTTISARGGLMTNPGHVDPGYSGYLKFTLINMGRDPLELRADNDVIVSLLLFRVDPNSRIGPGRDASVEDLNHLTRDFLQVQNRATSVAKAQMLKGGLISTVVVALAGLFLSSFLPFNIGQLSTQQSTIAKELSELEKRVQELEKANAKVLESSILKSKLKPSEGKE